MLVALAALLALVSGFVLFVPGFLLVAVAAEADHVINTAATLVAGATAILAWIRFRETGEADSLFQAAAFLVLFTGSVITVGVVVAGWQADLGFDRLAPGQAPLYLWTLQRSLAAPLLLVGALTALRRPADQPRTIEPRKGAVAGVVAPAAALVVGALVLFSLRDQLPELVGREALVTIAGTLETVQAQLLSVPMLVIQLALGGIFLAAAVGYGIAYANSGGHRPYHRYLSIGLVIAAFSQLHFAAIPGAYSDLLTSGDILRMTFWGVVAVGVAAAAREDLIELREANVTLHGLRAADNERIALAERARLAREIHDGLVQELWLARLTHGRLVQALREHDPPRGAAREAESSRNSSADNRDVGVDLEQSAEQVDRALENALAEARQAVVTLQPSPDASFGNLLRRFVEDYGDRFGLEVECSVEGEAVSLGGQRQAEVLRICREALNNARKHADATLVRVYFSADAAGQRLTVTDNGRGFDASAPPRQGFGLKGMRERAAEIGATLRIDSAPMDGTRVTLELSR